MIISYLIILIIILIDFATKQMFSAMYHVNQIEVIIPDFLIVGHIQNTGASFGLFEGQQLLFFVITIAALSLFGYLFAKSDIKQKTVYTLSLILLISGTLGNAIDRLFYGYVIDFIRVPFLPFVGNTYFNVADTALNIGIGLMVVDIIFLERKRDKKNEDVEPTNDSSES